MNPFRRAPAPGPAPLADLPTRSVAVGSLAGIAPARVRANLLIVVSDDGDLLMSGTACDEMAITMLAGCTEIVARRLYEAHAHATGEAL